MTRRLSVLPRGLGGKAAEAVAATAHRTRGIGIARPCAPLGLDDKTVEDVMAAPLPTIGAGQPVALAVEMLESCSAMLVLDGGRPRAVVSSTDVLNFLSDAQGA